MQKIIIINASAAKSGGAETILRTFIENITYNSGLEYIVLSPIKFERSALNVQFIYKKTSGFGTIFFSSIGILFYILKFKPVKLISFNNINCIFFSKIGITYFHQLKALKEDYKDIKLKVYNFLIRCFLRDNTFVVQSQYIKELFLKKFSLRSDQVIVCWPGFSLPQETCDLDFDEFKGYSYLGILPIAYGSKHKNVEILNELEGYFLEGKISIITLLVDNEVLKNEKVFKNIGKISRGCLFKVYQKVDFLIFSSTEETVGLPIFEFLQTGKPAFVFAAPYAVYLHKQFNSPSNFVLFSSVEDFKKKFLNHISEFNNRMDYSIGEWDKILSLL